MSRDHYQNHIDSWTAYEVIDEADHRFMLEWDWLDEGFNGDYNEDDPDDAPLLRFTVFTRPQHTTEGDVGDWEAAEDASYCTENAIDTDRVHLESMAHEILTEFKRSFLSGSSWKKPMERCSWITPTRGARS